MKTKKIILAILLGVATVSCSGDKSSSENTDNNSEESTTVALDDALNGTWVITSIDGDGGISKDVKFIFKDNNLTLDAGYYKDDVKMLKGDKQSMSYKDQNDITWDYNYNVSGNSLKLDNLFSGKVHATYHLEKE